MRPPFLNWLTISAFCAMSVCLLPAQQKASSKKATAVNAAGQQLFRQHCSVCHGVDGKGRGPMYDPNAGEKERRIPPADLTLLSQKNGGKFPAERVGDAINSKRAISEHGTSDMPAWGDIFYNLKTNPKELNRRVADLTAYIESIQVP